MSSKHMHTAKLGQSNGVPDPILGIRFLFFSRWKGCIKNLCTYICLPHVAFSSGLVWFKTFVFFEYIVSDEWMGGWYFRFI